MAWITTTGEQDAHGLLAEIYEAAIRRAGRTFNILRIQSHNPPVLKSSLDLYLHVMRGESPLSRRQREMLAVVVSAANECHY